ncbi:MAG: AAA family ATPase [Halioglobus sp.]
MDSDSIRQLIGSLPPAHQCTLRETHISWVILCGDFAYKIKKPVNFDFLDFSTVEKRRHYCNEELRLNRRFAPGLYLAVIPITRTAQELQFDGSGEIVDYAVKMQRFDESQLLDNIAARGELDAMLLRAVGKELAGLHAKLPVCNPDPCGSEPGSPVALRAAIEQNMIQVRQYALRSSELQQLDIVEHWILRRYSDLLPVMKNRVAQGWIIDGHGDAHLGNIAMFDGAVQLFDCIEFNPAFRIMDSISEIAFLSMDIEARGHTQAAHRLLSDYLEYRGDYAGLVLLNLYRCYFAMVRAKVALLREPRTNKDIGETPGFVIFRRYLELACSYTQSVPGFVAITHGVSGTGKSTIAGELVACSGAVRLRSDVERKRLVGLAPEQRSTLQDKELLYSTGMTRATFARLQVLAGVILDAGFAVIVDATFLHRRARDPFRELAHSLELPFIIVDCLVEPGQLRQRLIAREDQAHDASEAGVTVMEGQLREAEPLTAVEQNCRLLVNTQDPGDELWREFQQRLLHL